MTPEQELAISYIRALVNKIPENKDLPPPQFFLDPRSLSMLNMIKGGSNTALNWLEGKPEIGPDTLAPLGLAGVGAAVARGAVPASGITAADRVRSRWHGLRDEPEAVTGGSPGYALPPDKYSNYPVPANKMSSTGLEHYHWYGMRDARTGEPLPNPRPDVHFRKQGSDIEEMTRDISGRIERGELDAPETAATPYDAALARQQDKGGLEVIAGDRRDTRRMNPANDLQSDPRSSLPGMAANAQGSNTMTPEEQAVELARLLMANQSQGYGMPPMARAQVGAGQYGLPAMPPLEAAPSPERMGAPEYFGNAVGQATGMPMAGQVAQGVAQFGRSVGDTAAGQSMLPQLWELGEAGGRALASAIPSAAAQEAQGGAQLAGDRLQQLMTQRAVLEQRRQAAEVDMQREQRTGKGPNYSAAQQKYNQVSSEVAGLDALIAEEQKVRSPKFQLEMEQSRADAERDQRVKESNLLLTEKYPWAAPASAGAGLVGSAIAGRYLGKRGTEAFNAAMADLNQRWGRSVGRAQRSVPGGSAHARSVNEAEEFARKYVEMTSKGPSGGKGMVAGATAAEIGGLAPPVLDYVTSKPGTDARQRAKDNLTDPAGMAARIFGTGLLGAYTGKFANSLQRAKAHTPIGYGAETSALSQALAGLPQSRPPQALRSQPLPDLPPRDPDSGRFLPKPKD